LAVGFAVLVRLWRTSLQRIGAAKLRKIKDDLSQLNRLDGQDVASNVSATNTSFKTIYRYKTFGASSFQLLLSVIQVLTTNKQLANSSSGSN